VCLHVCVYTCVRVSFGVAHPISICVEQLKKNYDRKEEEEESCRRFKAGHVQSPHSPICPHPSSRFPITSPRNRQANRQTNRTETHTHAHVRVRAHTHARAHTYTCTHAHYTLMQIHTHPPPPTHTHTCARALSLSI